MMASAQENKVYIEWELTFMQNVLIKYKVCTYV